MKLKEESMRMQRNVGDSYLLERIGIAAGLLLLMSLSGARALAQQVPGAANNDELTIAELLKMPGRLLGEGKNTSPAGQFQLLKYRVEELQLPRSIKLKLHGQQVEVDKAWRLTITGGPFPVRALPAVIWVDDQMVGYGVENERLSEITAVTFDRALLREGGTISLSYGEDKQGRVKLPEKLKLSDAPKGGNQ
jgi:hypothetical protein